MRLLLTLAALAGALLSQSDPATVRGTAADPSGAVTPKVQIRVTNIETNATRVAETNPEGDFRFPMFLRQPAA